MKLSKSGVKPACIRPWLNPPPPVVISDKTSIVCFVLAYILYFTTNQFSSKQILWEGGVGELFGKIDEVSH